MAAPIVAVATKVTGTKIATSIGAKKLVQTGATSMAERATSKTPYLDKLRAMKPKLNHNENTISHKQREKIQAGNDMMSETAAIKMLDDLLQKFKQIRGNANDKLKQGLVKEITAEASKNANLSSNMDSIAKDIKEANKPKHRNKMR